MVKCQFAIKSIGIELWHQLTFSSYYYIPANALKHHMIVKMQQYIFERRSFAASAPKLWNSLPLSLRDPTLTLTSSCSRLKTDLFSMAYGRALVTASAVRTARYKFPHTYIHTGHWWCDIYSGNNSVHILCTAFFRIQFNWSAKCWSLFWKYLF